MFLNREKTKNSMSKEAPDGQKKPKVSYPGCAEYARPPYLIIYNTFLEFALSIIYLSIASEPTLSLSEEEKL
jgi:hypothetical protein